MSSKLFYRIMLPLDLFIGVINLCIKNYWVAGIWFIVFCLHYYNWNRFEVKK